MKFNKDQRKQMAEIMGNVSVAWFSAGVIAPFFIRFLDVNKFLLSYIVGFTFSIIAAILSLMILNK